MSTDEFFRTILLPFGMLLGWAVLYHAGRDIYKKFKHLFKEDEEKTE